MQLNKSRSEGLKTMYKDLKTAINAKAEARGDQKPPLSFKKSCIGPLWHLYFTKYQHIPKHSIFCWKPIVNHSIPVQEFESWVYHLMTVMKQLNNKKKIQKAPNFQVLINPWDLYGPLNGICQIKNLFSSWLCALLLQNGPTWLDSIPFFTLKILCVSKHNSVYHRQITPSKYKRKPRITKRNLIRFIYNPTILTLLTMLHKT